MFEINKSSEEMAETITAFSNDLKNIRTGRVSPDILKSVVVDSYGSKMPLPQLSNINNIDNMTLSINIWDSSLVKLVEKSILESNLGANPQTEGNNILLKFPELTAERRKELVKQAKSEIEEAKIAIRNARKEANNEIKKSNEFSEDVKKNSELDIQEITDNSIKKVDIIFSQKQEEIMTL